MPDAAMRDALDATFSKRVRDLSGRLSKGEIDLMEWQITMREELRSVHALQLIAGAGGDKSQVSADDWLKLGSELRSQYLYLEDFARAVERGDLSDAQLSARAELYAHSARTTYWKQATSGVDLPAMPGEGSECLTNCNCSWDKRGDGWHWVLHASESCPTCIDRAAKWSPYRSVN